MAELSNKYDITFVDLTAYCDQNAILQLSADDVCTANNSTLSATQAALIDILMQDVIEQIESRFRHNYEIPFGSPLNKSIKGIVCRLTCVAMYKRRAVLPEAVAESEEQDRASLEQIINGETEIYGLTRTRPHMDSKRR